MRPIIQVENLGKKYTIRHQGGSGAGYRRLSEDLAAAIKRPFRRRKSEVRDQRSEIRSATSDVCPPPSALRPPFSESFWALRDVSFDVQPGEVLGIIGRNGAGKSTLLKILSRITEPTEGRVTLRGRVASLLEVGTGFHPELTGRENVYLNGAVLGMSRAEIKRKFDEIVAFAEVEKFLDTPVKHYSSGMYVRLAFAVAAHLEPEILIVDEILAVGDAEFQKKCLGKMSEVALGGRTVLFVSHNTAAIQSLCSRGLVLNCGKKDLDSTAVEAVGYYTERISLSCTGQTSSPHILYERPLQVGADFGWTRMEALDRGGHPKHSIATWDDVLFRISYSCRRRVTNGSVAFSLTANGGPTIILLSTKPDGNMPVSLEPGEHSIECFVERIPLAAGEYYVSGGLARPNIEWLCYEREIARVTVCPKDVYRSGSPPVAPRSLVAVTHQWRTVC
jgi:lipopolysaccharide transport system ATP-binding protein